MRLPRFWPFWPWRLDMSTFLAAVRPLPILVAQQANTAAAYKAGYVVGQIAVYAIFGCIVLFVVLKIFRKR